MSNGEYPRNILLVEDNEHDRELFEEALKSACPNAQIRTAGSGLEALRRLHDSNELPHLILSDLEMPLMDGTVLLAHLQDDDRLREIPMIIWTTNASDESRKICEALGVTRFLAKPSTFEGLTSTLVSLTEQIL